LKQILYTL